MTALVAERLPDCGSASPLSRNMSAPPRMQITITTLGRVPGEERVGALNDAPPGFRLHARLHLDTLLEHHLGGEGRNDNREWRKALPWRKRLPTSHETLRCLVLLARQALDADYRPEAVEFRRLKWTNLEALTDTFIDLAGGLNPHALGLPCMGFIRGLDEGPSDALLDPATALALFSRQDGALFLAGRSPSLPSLGSPARWKVGLYVPEGGR